MAWRIARSFSEGSAVMKSPMADFGIVISASQLAAQSSKRPSSIESLTNTGDCLILEVIGTTVTLVSKPSACWRVNRIAGRR